MRIAALVLVLACASSLGCESWDPAIRARQRAAETWACDSVETTQLEENRWHAVGCGHEGDFACTSGALEPTCIQVRTAGGERPDEEEEARAATPSVTDSEAALWAQAEREDPGDDAVADENVPPPPATSVVSASEAAIRSGLDARRVDVFACTEREPTVVRVTYAADGTVDVRLGGGLEGTPEEACVRAALEGVRASGGDSGLVIHLVHRPAP